MLHLNQTLKFKVIINPTLQIKNPNKQHSQRVGWFCPKLKEKNEQTVWVLFVVEAQTQNKPSNTHLRSGKNKKDV